MVQRYILVVFFLLAVLERYEEVTGEYRCIEVV